MRKFMVILGLLSSLIALGLAISTIYIYTYIPIILSLIFGFIAFYMGRNHNYPKKPVQFIFIVAIIAISIAVYKTIYSDALVGSDNLINSEFNNSN